MFKGQIRDTLHAKYREKKQNVIEFNKTCTMKYLFTCVYETANKLMTFPDKVPLEVSEAVSLHDRGANITQHSRVMTDEQRKENTFMSKPCHTCAC